MLPKDIRETILKERLKGAEDRRKIHDKNLNSHKYWAAVDDTTPLYFHLDIGPQYPQKPVCMNAFRNVLALYRRPWEKLKRSVSAGSYVAGPADSYADCYATRFICEKTSVGLRNNEISVIELPSNMTYQNINKPTADSKGNFGSVYLFEERPYDELTFPVGSQGHVCSWSSFQKIWKKYFPNIEICNRCEDVCGECVWLQNSFQYIKKQKQNKEQEQLQQEKQEENDDSSQVASATNSSKESGNETRIGDDDTSLVEDLQEKEFPEEYLWFRANDHAMKAQKQLVKDREREAKSVPALLCWQATGRNLLLLTPICSFVWHCRRIKGPSPVTWVS